MQYLYIVNEQTKTEFLLSYENLRTCFDKKQLPKQYPVGTIFLVIANFLLLIFSRKSDRCLEQIDSNQMAHILSKLHAEHKNFSDTKILLYQIFDDLEAYDSNLETKFPIHVLQLIESFCSESSFCENGKLKNALLHLGKLPLLRKDFPLPDFEDMPDKNTLKHYCKVFMFSPDFEFLSCDIEGIEALTWLCGSCKSLQKSYYYNISDFFDIINASLQELFKLKYIIKHCQYKNCGRIFIPYKRADEKYCSFIKMNAKGSCKYLASLDKQRKYQNNPLVKQYRNLYIGFSNSYNYRKGSTNSDNLWLDIQTAYHKKCCQFRSSIHESNSIKEQYAEYLKTVKKLKKQFPDVSDFYAKFSEYNDSIKL